LRHQFGIGDVQLRSGLARTVWARQLLVHRHFTVNRVVGRPGRRAHTVGHLAASSARTIRAWGGVWRRSAL